MRVGIVYFTEDRVEQETEKIHFSALLGFLISLLRWGIYPVEHYPTMLSVLNVGEGKGGVLKNMKRA